MGDISTVVFDIGETLVCEDRSWRQWATWLGISSGAVFAALGAVATARGDYRDTFSLLRPGFDFESERTRKELAGFVDTIEVEDLYEDARPCLEILVSLGYRVGVAGNQPARVEAMVAAFELPVDFVISSGGLGVAKPSAAFFEAVVSRAGVDASAIAYVGDRVDNDVLPAKEAGTSAIFLRRGPWGFVQASWPEAQEADAQVESLAQIPGLLESWKAAS